MLRRGPEPGREGPVEPARRGGEGLGRRGVPLGELGPDRLQVREGEGAAGAVGVWRFEARGSRGKAEEVREGRARGTGKEAK